MRLEKIRQNLYIGEELVVDCAVGTIMSKGKICNTIPIESIRKCWDEQTEAEAEAMSMPLVKLCGAFDYFCEAFYSDEAWQEKFKNFMPIAEKFANLENGISVQTVDELDMLKELVNNKFLTYFREETKSDVLRDSSIFKFYKIRASISDELYISMLRLCGDKLNFERLLLSWTIDPQVLEWMLFCWTRKHYEHIYADGWEEFCKAVRSHFESLKVLSKDFDFPKNWFDTYCNTKHELELEKDKERDRRLKEKQGSWLDFDLPGNSYIIFVPRTSQDFKDEGDQQSNCVYRSYVEEVANGGTNIVCMRKRAEPWKSILTLQVERKYGINQCLASHNRESRPYLKENPEAKALYDAYEKHLKSV